MRSKSTFEIPCASSLPRLLERKETKHYASLTVLLLPVSLERRRRNESSQCTACSKKKIWRASHNCRHPSIPEARKLKTNRKRAWVLGECQGVGRGMCYAGHGWSVIDSNKGHICVAIKSFNSSQLFHMKRSFTRTVLEQQNRQRSGPLSGGKN